MIFLHVHRPGTLQGKGEDFFSITFYSPWDFHWDKNICVCSCPKEFSIFPAHVINCKHKTEIEYIFGDFTAGSNVHFLGWEHISSSDARLFLIRLIYTYSFFFEIREVCSLLFFQGDRALACKSYYVQFIFSN